IVIRPPPPSTLFPYTTLFRSSVHERSSAVPRIYGGVGLDVNHRVLGAQLARYGADDPHAHRILEPQRASKSQDELTLAQRLGVRSEEHTSELQSRFDLVCRLL